MARTVPRPSRALGYGVRVRALRRRNLDPRLLELFEGAGRNVRRTSVLVRDLLADYPERVELAEEIALCEQVGDGLARDVFHHLNRPRGRRPVDSSDLHALASALDDIVDYAEETADALGLYGIEAPMEQAVVLADVLVAAATGVAGSLESLRAGQRLEPHLEEIHRLEREGDRLVREAIASLFARGIDPMFVIRWKGIFESLEEAIDACDTVANALEGIVLKLR